MLLHEFNDNSLVVLLAALTSSCDLVHEVATTAGGGSNGTRLGPGVSSWDTWVGAFRW